VEIDGKYQFPTDGHYMLWIAPSEKDSATATLEKRLWDAADQLCANSKLTYSEHAMPVLGVIFLCHTANRCYAAIEADQADGKMPKRPLVRADFAKRRQHGAPADLESPEHGPSHPQ
jgi:hypothetical protein